MATVDALLDKVKDMAPTIRRHAEEAEQARRLSRPVVDAMRQAGLYRMARPKAFSGLELDPVSIFRVVEEVARHDSAAGRAYLYATFHENWEAAVQGAAITLERKLQMQLATTHANLAAAKAVDLNRSTGDWYTQAATFACSSAAIFPTAAVTAGA